MKRLRKLTFWLCAILSTLITVALVIGHALGQAPALPFDERYLPGMPIPNLPSTCYWESYGFGYNTCVAVRTPAIYYDRRYDDSTIQDVLFETPGTKLGDFINVWGQPVGANYWLHGAQVFWPGGYSAWIFDKLSPDSEVGFVEIDPHETPSATPWHGFSDTVPTTQRLPGMP